MTAQHEGTKLLGNNLPGRMNRDQSSGTRLYNENVDKQPLFETTIHVMQLLRAINDGLQLKR